MPMMLTEPNGPTWKPRRAAETAGAALETLSGGAAAGRGA